MNKFAIFSDNSNVKLEEMKRKREERKLQRQRELEARRTARTQQGPMKLATKKQPPF